MKNIGKMALVLIAQIVMAAVWIAAQRLVYSLGYRLSGGSLLASLFSIPFIIVGAIAYFIGLRLVVGAVYDIGNGKGPRAWLRAIRRSLRITAEAEA